METNGTTKIEMDTMYAVQGVHQKMAKLPELTIRDLFAMSALSAIGNGSWNGSLLNFIISGDRRTDDMTFDEALAKAAYKVADKMMEARKCNNM